MVVCAFFSPTLPFVVTGEEIKEKSVNVTEMKISERIVFETMKAVTFY